MKMDPKDFQEFLKKITPQIDVSEVLDMYKKNLDYVTSCNKVLMSTLQDVYNLNVDFMKQQSKTAKDNASNIMGMKNIGDYNQATSEAVKNYFKDYTEHLNNIKDNIVNSSSTISDIVKNKTSDVMSSAKEQMDKVKDNMKKASAK